MGFKEQPVRFRNLVAAKATAAAVAAVWLFCVAPPVRWLMLAFLILCGLVAGACKVDAHIKSARITMGFAVTFFTFLLLGTSEAVLVALVGMLVSCAIRTGADGRRQFRPARLLSHQVVYNASNSTLAILAMGAVFHQLGGRFGHSDIQAITLPSLTGALAYYVVNGVGISLAIGWAQKRSCLEIFRGYFLAACPGFLASAAFSVVTLWIYENLPGGLGALLFVPLTYLIFSSFNLRSEKMRGDIAHMEEVNRLNDSIISSLAAAVDAKDHHTGQHVDRVRVYALGLARKLGVTDAEMEAIRIAALLHDIGKIGIPESILCKPGKLTHAEFEIMKLHVDIGVAILEQVQFPWPVVPVVRSHHERWDGLGYPDGLRGDDIPIGGRIISLVDVYDALTSNRPYRRAIPRENAIQILRQGSGTQFDPTAVELFVELLPTLEATIAELDVKAETDTSPTVFAEVARRVAQLEKAADTVEIAESPCDEIEDALVLETLAGLEDAKSLSALLPILAERLPALVPHSTFACFLSNWEGRSVVPLHASGLWTELLDGLEIRIGEGASGYVASTGEAVVNAPASMDLARRIRPGANLELNSTLCVPLLLNGQVIGTLTAYHSAYNFYRPEHLHRLTLVGQFLVEKMGQEPDLNGDIPIPREDPVTGLPNAYALIQFLNGQLTVAQTREEEFSLLLFGAHLKRDAEEVLTPAERDRRLQVLGEALRKTVRGADYLARASTAGFAVVIPRCGEREATRIARRLLEQTQRQLVQKTSLPMPLDLGMSFYPADGGNAAAVLRCAEQRMLVPAEAMGSETVADGPARRDQVGSW